MSNFPDMIKLSNANVDRIILEKDKIGVRKFLS